MPNPDPNGNVPAQSAPPAALFDQRAARMSALAALAVIFACAAYSGELGFMVYAGLFAIPHLVFVAARGSRKWQAWGCAIAWATAALALLLAALTALKVMRQAQGPQILMLVFLLVLLLSQAAQLVFVRRAFTGTIAYGTPLFRIVLYYICVLLVVGATLPNWYVPPGARHDNKAFKTQR